MFDPLPSRFDFPAAERRVLEFWEREGVFAQSLKIREGRPRFVFYEGPPTANGLPHPGHCLTRAIKDLFPRYQTMCGKLVERKAGWDTHGLPVEVEVCKELGIHTKEEIETYGVANFVRRCIESVFRYTREWEELTRRLGFWVNLEDAYVTYHQSYVESVWWGLKMLFERGLLYQGPKVVWWWAQGGTALSAGEVGEGYRTVKDPAIYVRFPLLRGGTGVPPVSHGQDARATREDARATRQDARATRQDARATRQDARATLVKQGKRVSLLVWTTTPWTLISNHFAAVGPDIDYSLVHDQTTDEYLYIATALVGVTAEKVKHKLEVVANCKGADLVGLRYEPPFDLYANDVLSEYAGFRLETPRRCRDFESPLASKTERINTDTFNDIVKKQWRVGQTEYRSVGWRVVPADFVTLDTGTGIVHIAPAFGEADYQLWQTESDALLLGLPFFCAVRPDGCFHRDLPLEQYRGRFIFDCDAEIIRELKDRGILYHQGTIEHEYPFCPRAEEDKLIQYARRSWFVRTSQFKEEFLRNNTAMHWLPGHIREGRMADFLRNNVDWALSRERYWGTPLPIWVCERTGKMEAIGSFAELMSKPGATDGGFWERAKQEDPMLPEHLKVHKPYIDAWTYDSPFVSVEHGPPARMRRVPEVIDCWWDAGSMPFAQWGYPHVPASREQFAQRFPADFISEAIDQTRGWFYGLLAISTLLFPPAPLRRGDPPAGGPDAPSTPPGPAESYPLPFRTCLVLGHIAGEDGNKMSKRLRNYREPNYIFDTYGADAMRWFFFSAQPPWTSVRFQEAAIRDGQREFLLKLYNVLSFFTIYANIDGVDPRRSGGPRPPGGTERDQVRQRSSTGSVSARSGPSLTLGVPLGGLAPAGRSVPGASATGPLRRGDPPAPGWRPPAERTELDRWIISELRSTVCAVRDSLDRFENYPAAQRLSDFVDALSNWYVRRSRERFWRSAGPAPDPAKWDAYHTLYGCLRVLSRLIAPFTPFFAEVLYQHLKAPEDPLSVHLCDYPDPEEIGLGDESLRAEMNLVREIVSLGRAARVAAGGDPRVRKVRQPLARVEIILADPMHMERLRTHTALIAEELNVRSVEFTTEAEQYVTYRVQPNFRSLGAKYRELVPAIRQALDALPDAAGARRRLLHDGQLPLSVAGRELNLTRDEVEIRLEARPGWSAAQGRAGVVVISTDLTPELIEQGLIRELVHQVQNLRKECELPYEARIRLAIRGSAEFLAILARHGRALCGECLVTEVLAGGSLPGPATQIEVDGHALEIQIERL